MGADRPAGDWEDAVDGPQSTDGSLTLDRAEQAWIEGRLGISGGDLRRLALRYRRRREQRQHRDDDAGGRRRGHISDEQMEEMVRFYRGE